MTELVHSTATVGTHALVIGVGEYPSLNGGSLPLFPHHEGMGQLSSPPESARMFASWLLDGYRNTGSPLVSLDLLISDPSTSQFTPPGGTATTIERAEFDKVKKAMKAWLARGHTSPDNLMIFFYCGHGVARGPDMTLLPEDYGSAHSPPQLSLGLAIDFTQFYLGMDSCAARNQIYFIDACRVASGLLIRTHNFAGDPVIPGMGQLTTPPRNAPIYFGTMQGDTAFGRRGRESFFTEALLKAFRGAGADDDGNGNWRLQTDTLGKGIQHQLRRTVANTAASGQNSTATNVGPGIAFHELAGLPECPVDVMCEPQADTANAMLQVAGTTNGVQMARNPPTPPTADAWALDLDYGDYEFQASFAPPSTKQGRSVVLVAPPYRPVKIRVA
ncbi:MAG: caspase family protein [Burkholderiales bacterium]